VALAAIVGVQGVNKVTVRVLALTRYGSLGSSSRLRMLQYIPALTAANIEVSVQAMFDDATLALRYQLGRYGLLTLIRCFWQRISALIKRNRFDIVWIEKEALPWLPLWFERRLLSTTPYILDYDDAVFHHYDQHRLAAVRLFYVSDR
jgi:hypothetical protein